MTTAIIAIQHDFAYGSYCVSATGSDTWPSMTEKNMTVTFRCLLIASIKFSYISEKGPKC